MRRYYSNSRWEHVCRHTSDKDSGQHTTLSWIVWIELLLEGANQYWAGKLSVMLLIPPLQAMKKNVQQKWSLLSSPFSSDDYYIEQTVLAVPLYYWLWRQILLDLLLYHADFRRSHGEVQALCPSLSLQMLRSCSEYTVLTVLFYHISSV